jgi:membrane protein
MRDSPRTSSANSLATLTFATALMTAGMRWLQNDAPSRAAAIAFFATFALVPMSVMVLQVAAVFVGDAANVELLKRQLAQMVNTDAADVLGALLSANLSGVAATNWRWFSILSLLVAASATFSELRIALNRMANFPSAEGIQQSMASRFGWAWSLLKARFISLSIVMGLGFLLVAWLMIDTILALFFEHYLSGANELMAYVTITLITLSILLAIFYAFIRVLPERLISHRAAFTGASVAVALFIGGKWAMTASLSHVFNVSAFGAASGLIALLIWIFYAASVFLFGAQVAVVYDDARCDTTQ